ncbi:unnamed protein product [Ceratitis capitata]|uniref:(Mediterranean fruit fly) hypothetical protein n=1 Tax=Ceratitis capitata TaxID=7213 RepID=A0A811UMP7_CERCA|nr:unnamed protein product [Ceratitis capitata]
MRPLFLYIPLATAARRALATSHRLWPSVACVAGSAWLVGSAAWLARRLVVFVVIITCIAYVVAQRSHCALLQRDFSHNFRLIKTHGRPYAARHRMLRARCDSCMVAWSPTTNKWCSKEYKKSVNFAGKR